MQAHANMHANVHANLHAPCHVLPTLPEPEPGSHGHAMPPFVPGRYDEPLDLGTGQAAFAIACVVLALTLGMGGVAISHLTDRDSLAAHSPRAVAQDMDARDKGARSDLRTDGGRYNPVSVSLR